ncbi:MAG: hypothetical protein ABW151_14835, partial [Pseudorhodoplanes sp.]
MPLIGSKMTVLAQFRRKIFPSVTPQSVHFDFGRGKHSMAKFGCARTNHAKVKIGKDIVTVLRLAKTKATLRSGRTGCRNAHTEVRN